ncbi:DUF6912 family protein [Luteimicrobium subarcticum]|uniref:Uncharacterized protein n=1 Tax=Luteimicrobium subarcticum TaxID=620910 RepID=A0A2M8WWC2_9MICO|nr:hypothetical protein [Luteimicrobium subarcticum]PJI95217.1 hypothetical protein CLV34_0091 [Luteimicrobium subarcticum]
MRLYVPATSDDLDAVQVTAHRATWAVGPRGAHAVTSALTVSLPDEDDEGVEYAAWLAAVDDSLGLVLGGQVAPLRVVITVEVPDDAVGRSDAQEDVAESAVDVQGAVDAQVVCVHVDEPEAAADVLAVGSVAEADLDEALQAVVDRDLLWYDWSEVRRIPTGDRDED